MDFTKLNTYTSIHLFMLRYAKNRFFDFNIILGSLITEIESQTNTPENGNIS